MLVLQGDWDPGFSDASHRFRPERSAHQVVERAQKHIRAGYAHVVDLDLEKFFDRVNHDILMGLMANFLRCRANSPNFGGDKSPENRDIPTIMNAVCAGLVWLDGLPKRNRTQPARFRARRPPGGPWWDWDRKLIPRRRCGSEPGNPFRSS